MGLQPMTLLAVIVLGVGLVVLLITWLKVPAFVGLLIGSVFVGLVARMPLVEIPERSSRASATHWASRRLSSGSAR